MTGVKSQSLGALSSGVRLSRTFCQIDLNQMNRPIILVGLQKRVPFAVLHRQSLVARRDFK